MTTNGDHDALVEYKDHRNAPQETKSRPVAAANQSPTRRGTKEDGSVVDVWSSQENVTPDSERTDAVIPIGKRVESFMNALVVRVYEINERADTNTAATGDGEIERSDRHSKDDIKVDE